MTEVRGRCPTGIPWTFGDTGSGLGTEVEPFRAVGGSGPARRVYNTLPPLAGPVCGRRRSARPGQALVGRFIAVEVGRVVEIPGK